MRVLISNDDGHFSAGIAALEHAARSLGDDLWVVAPERKRSSMGHSVSLHEPFTMTRLEERHYACSGTPADCVAAALAWLFKDSAQPDLVLSGINEGRNIGEDVAYSGTMAIAREASFWGIPAVAFSSPKTIDFDAPGARDWLAQLVQALGRDTAAWHRPDHWLSVNLPARLPAQIRHAVPGRAKIASEVQAEPVNENVTKLRYSGERRMQAVPDDELSRLDAGYGTVYRMRWNGIDRPDDAMLERMNASIGMGNRSGTGLQG